MGSYQEVMASAGHCFSFCFFRSFVVPLLMGVDHGTDVAVCCNRPH